MDNNRELMVRALAEIKDLRARLKSLQDAAREPIAIIGIGSRLPGGNAGPDSFWRFISSGGDASVDIPNDRWNMDDYYHPNPDMYGKIYCKRACVIQDIAGFDPIFFNITPREAVRMDPQHRLLLETSWEALESAALNPDRLYNSDTAVFCGISSYDYGALQLDPRLVSSIDGYAGTGLALSAANGRLSHFLGLRGPSLAVDTACSSSLVAIHLACQSLRKGETSLALAGGVNAIISPEIMAAFSRAKMLSPDGRCKTFDMSADGYVRGEGCGVLVLKRLSDALSNGDNILAVIRGSAVNQDGASGGLTVPSGPAQEAVIRAALKDGGIEPSEVSYIEAHGTGTVLGDPIEANAIGNVFCRGVERDKALMVGSVKTNIGHLEAAAGVTGVIKVVLSMMHGEIPVHLHYRERNRHIEWGEESIEVVRERRGWEGRKVAGVSSFGFSGTNGHVVLEGWDKKGWDGEDKGRGEEVERSYKLMLSGRDEAGLREIVRRYEEYIEGGQGIGEICYTANTGRRQFRHRLIVEGRSSGEVLERLRGWSEGVGVDGIYEGEAEAGKVVDVRDGDSGEVLRDAVRAERVEWGKYYSGMRYKKVWLPTYPFQRQRYWIDRKGLIKGQISELSNKPIERHLNVPTHGERIIETTIVSGTHQYLFEHVVIGKTIVPAAFYIAQIASVSKEILGKGTLSIKDMTFKQPLELSPDRVSKLQTILKYKPAEDSIPFEIISISEDAKGFISHVSGEVSKTASRNEGISLEEIRSSFTQEVALSKIQEMLESKGMPSGPSYNWISGLWKKEDQVLCSLSAPSNLMGLDRYEIHPTLIDACFRAGVLLIDDNEAAYIPASVHELSLLPVRTVQGLWCLVSRIDTDQSGMSTDISLFDNEGRALLVIKGLWSRNIKPQKRVILSEGGAITKPNALTSSIGKETGSISQPLSEGLSKYLHIKEDMKNLSPPQQAGHMLSYLKVVAKRLMQYEENRELDEEMALMDLGFDSLMAVEMTNIVSQDLSINIPPDMVFNYPSLEDMAGYLCKELFGKGTGTASNKIDEDRFNYIDELDEDALKRMIELDIDKGGSA